MSTAAALDKLRAGNARAALILLAENATDDAASHEARGMALLATGEPAAARQAFDMSRARGNSSPALLLNLALAEEGAGDPERARSMMRALSERLEDWDEPPLRLAESLRAAGEAAAAEIAYTQVLARNPLRPEAMVGLAALRIGRGDSEGARPLLLRCVEHYPALAEAWNVLGLIMMHAGDTSAAASAFAEANTHAPANLDYALHRIHAICSGGVAGEPEAELARLELAARADPLNPVLPTARGALLERLGRRSEAIDALEVAVVLAPNEKIPAVVLAGLLARTPRGAEAEAALRRAMELAPDNPLISNDLGAVLMRRHRHAEAVQVLRDLRERCGESPIWLCNLATATVSIGRQAEAVAIARRVLELAPEAMQSWRVLANVLPYSPDVSPAELLAALRGISDRIPRPAARESAAFDAPRDPAKRLRVGLLSGSLCFHPVGWLTVAGFENLDPAAFEIVCLVQHGLRDPIARRFRTLASAWHDVDGLTDTALAELSRALNIDILIDLGGHGDSGRMAACAQRLAPVQVKWVGMQNHSTGMAEMDWFITDRWETPPALRGFYSERLLPLADGYVCYSPPAHAPDTVPLPALTRGYVTFGCFNNLAKVTPVTIATWCEVLRRLPDARLVLKTHQFSDAETRAEVLSAFVAHGVAASRIELRGASHHREFLRQYNDIDIVLDPFPYSGGLTTCEALWMGVPTVTLPGEIFAARHSLSHLSNAGLPDWAATSREDYVELALRKAADLPALAALRVGLRAHVQNSPLCDAPRFGRSLGAALRHAWCDWCAQA